MQDFDAIRPYSDAEAPAVIRRLLEDREFLDMIARFRSPLLARWLAPLVRVRVRRWLESRFSGIQRVDDMQAQLSEQVSSLIGSTTTRVTHSGLENLDKHSAHLFVSNHRDIVFDPMLVNYLLFSNGFTTTRIAIGDNLLSNRVFAEMMRLNKSFVVRRNVASPREMRNAFMTLSGFINHSINDNHSIWIAQREGRAKDGVDVTDPAIIKMFYMSCKKSGLSFAEAMNRLHIVPVSIAYEYDPCDVDKAKELEERARTGQYQKAPDEDSAQIIKGLTGFKGNVHVHFGKPVTNAPELPRLMAERIDHDIQSNYHLHASNLAAYNLKMRQRQPSGCTAEPADEVATADTRSRADLKAAETELRHRMEACPEAARPYLLDMYANPVVSALKHSAMTG